MVFLHCCLNKVLYLLSWTSCLLINFIIVDSSYKKQNNYYCFVSLLWASYLSVFWGLRYLYVVADLFFESFSTRNNGKICTSGSSDRRHNRSSWGNRACFLGAAQSFGDPADQIFARSTGHLVGQSAYCLVIHWGGNTWSGCVVSCFLNGFLPL